MSKILKGECFDKLIFISPKEKPELQFIAELYPPFDDDDDWMDIRNTLGEDYPHRMQVKVSAINWRFATEDDIESINNYLEKYDRWIDPIRLCITRKGYTRIPNGAPYYGYTEIPYEPFIKRENELREKAGLEKLVYYC